MHLSRIPVGPDDDPVARLQPGTWLVDADTEVPETHWPDRLLSGVIWDGGSRDAGAGEGAMAMSLCTPRLLRPDLGSALVARLALHGLRLDDLATLALHEIMLNAAIHGNLEVASGRAVAWHDLAAREVAIAAALDDPVRAGRLVTIAVGWDKIRIAVLIADQGNGYRPPQPVPPATGTRRGAGRGLSIARAAADVDILDGGRCTRLLFRRLGAPAPT